VNHGAVDRIVRLGAGLATAAAPAVPTAAPPRAATGP